MGYAVEVEPGVLELRPQTGPQTAFLSTSADLAFYGGSAGGGKSGGLLLAASAFVHVPGYEAVIFRRESVQLTGAGSLWQDSQEIYRLLGGRSTQTPYHLWRFEPEGGKRKSTIEFRHLQREDDKLDHQGKQYAFIGFDELTHFTESQFWYLYSRARSTCGVNAMIRATLNPDPDHWVRRFIAWWIGDDGYPLLERSGVIRWFLRDGDDEVIWADSREELLAQRPGSDPKSFTFIAARLKDNPALTKADPGYRGRLQAMSRVDRMRLLGDEDRGGNWDTKAAAGELFRRDWFTEVDVVPAGVTRTVRTWDLASTKPHKENPDPDWTRGAKVSLLSDGRWIIEHIDGLRDTPGVVEQRMLAIASQDGKRVEIAFPEDPGQSGVAQAAALVKKFAGYRTKAVRTSQKKVAYAKVWSPLAEHGHILILKGAWNESFYREIEEFREDEKHAHDDQVDAVSLAFRILTGPAKLELDSKYDADLPTFSIG